MAEERDDKFGPVRQDRRDRVEFVYTMLGELQAMAASDRHAMLAYLIGMAHAEAGDLLRKRRPSEIRQDK